jgi:dipeptidyl aminopeptidase/acylaminoacyl peptidase
LDYLETRKDIDHRRFEMMGWSLGGYFAPRAAAFEKRFKLCVAWALITIGANYRGAVSPIPHYWDHVMWVWGKDSLEAFMDYAPRVSLVGVMGNITIPLLITHGANDRQILLAYAQQSYDEAVNSPLRGE